MKVGNLIYTDMKRSIFSLRFLLSVFGITMMMFSAIIGMIPSTTSRSIWYFMELSIQGSGINSTTFCILPVFAFGLSYAMEKEVSAERYWIIRTGTRNYALSKVWNSAFSGFFTVFLGISFFAILLFPFLPFYTQSFTDGTYETLMADGKVLFGFLLYASHHGCTGAITAVCAMWFSTLLPNRFAAASAPLVIYFTILRIWNGNDLSPIHPIYWNSGVYYAETAEKTILIKIVISFLLCAIMGVGIKYNIERRLLHE